MRYFMVYLSLKYLRLLLRRNILKFSVTNRNWCFHVFLNCRDKRATGPGLEPMNLRMKCHVFIHSAIAPPFFLNSKL